MKSKGTCFIDTCVILEVLVGKKSERKGECERFLRKIGNVYDGMVSVSVLGEYVYIACTKEKHQAERLLEFLSNAIIPSNTQITFPNKDTMKIFDNLNEIDDRIEFMDALHLACAINHKADYFVTLETRNFSKEIEKKYLIKIREPKNLK